MHAVVISPSIEFMRAGLNAVVGSGDDRHFDRIAVECAEAMAQADADCADRIAEGAPTAAEALRSVIDTSGPYSSQWTVFTNSRPLSRRMSTAATAIRPFPSRDAILHFHSP